MGFFSKVFKSISGDGGGGSLAGSLIQAGGAIGGAIISSRANDKAAQRVAEAQAANAASIREATEATQKRYDEQTKLAKPGTDHLRQLASRDPTGLTPYQQEGLESAMKDANATLAASGLRGAGGAVTAALKDVNRSFRNKAIEANTNRQHSAATQLSNQGFTSGRASAEAGFRGATGAANATMQGAATAAQAGLANAGLRGAALGDVSSIIADEIKTRGRESKYDKDKYQEEGV